MALVRNISIYKKTPNKTGLKYNVFLHSKTLRGRTIQILQVHIRIKAFTYSILHLINLNGSKLREESFWTKTTAKSLGLNESVFSPTIQKQECIYILSRLTLRLIQCQMMLAVVGPHATHVQPFPTRIQLIGASTNEWHLSTSNCN